MSAEYALQDSARGLCMARNRRSVFILLGLTLWLVSCAQRPWTSSTTSTEPPPKPPAQTWSAPTPSAPEVTPPPAEAAARPEPTPSFVSHAKTPKDYRADAARHLYDTYQHRIYQGKLPPMLKAVGVVEVAVNSKGQVEDIVWLRAPRHVPEVMREIETALRQAAPYPAPVHMKHVKYIDTWLWHASGRFQLDTLTEGQY